MIAVVDFFHFFDFPAVAIFVICYICCSPLFFDCLYVFFWYSYFWETKGLKTTQRAKSTQVFLGCSK